MYKDGLSIHKNRFKTFANLTFIPEVFGLLLLLATTTAIVLGVGVHLLHLTIYCHGTQLKKLWKPLNDLV